MPQHASGRITHLIGCSDKPGQGHQYAYDAYGIPYLVDPGTGAQTQVAAGQPYLFTGRRFDFETSLYYYRARYYSAAIGRFLQTDPVGYKDQMNLYAYVGNDPVNGWDPTGEATCANPDCKTSYIDPVVGQQGIPPIDSSLEGSPDYEPGAVITFENDNPSGASPNQPVTTDAAIMVEESVIASGVDSVNINSTTGGVHNPTSRHYTGQAVDIDHINGNEVGTPASMGHVASLQESFAQHPNIRENYGLNRQEKTFRSRSGLPVTRPHRVGGHRRHVHFSSQPRARVPLPQPKPF